MTQWIKHLNKFRTRNWVEINDESKEGMIIVTLNL